MTTKALSALLFIIFLISACKPVLKMSGNYKSPKKENPISIKNYCSRNDVKYDLMFCAKSESDYKAFLKMYNAIPTTLIYNRAGDLVSVNSGSDCPWQTLQKFKELNDSNKATVVIIKDRNISGILSHLHCIDGDSTSLSNNDYDYLFVYTWAKFIPKLSKGMFAASKDVKSNAHFRVKVIAVDLDLQDTW